MWRDVAILNKVVWFFLTGTFEQRLAIDEEESHMDTYGRMFQQKKEPYKGREVRVCLKARNCKEASVIRRKRAGRVRRWGQRGNPFSWKCPLILQYSLIIQFPLFEPLMENSTFEHKKFQWGTWNSNIAESKTQLASGELLMQVVIYTHTYIYTHILHYTYMKWKKSKRWDEKVVHTCTIIDYDHSLQYPGYHRI